LARFTPSVLLLLALAACGDPLDRVEKLSEVELSQEPAAAALPTAEELNRQDGFFSRVLRRDPPQDDVAAAVASAETAIATPDEIGTDVAAEVASQGPEVPEAREEIASETIPAGDDELLQESVVQVGDAVVQPPVDVIEKKGLRGWFKSAAAASAKKNAEVELTDQSVAPEQELAIEPEKAAVVLADLPAATPDLVEAPKRRGLFGLGRDPASTDGSVRTASLSPDPQALPRKRVRATRSEGRIKSRTGPGVRDVGFGVTLPYGVVGRSCEAKGQALGRKLDKAPARGKGYALFDSAPDSTGPRTFFVTGFSDGCPRQFTAALALFGAPTMHEQLRYGQPSKEYPYSATDQAYEKVKSAVCGVGKRKPCGAKISQLERNTVFISTYERFSNNARWADILIHDGVVLAASIKAP
jgi:hypothetical protein